MSRRTLSVALMALAALLASHALAAVPSSGTLSPSTPVVSYVGGPYTASNPSNQNGPPDCDLVPNSCDDFLLTVDVSAAYLDAHPGTLVQIRVEWPGPSDFDLYLQDPSSGMALQSSGNTAGEPETINFYAAPGPISYRIRALAFAALNETITGTIRLLNGAPPDTGLAAYVESSDVFTCNVHLAGQSAVFDHGGDGEPAVAIDKDGNTWITGIAGVGAGIGLWKIASTDLCAQDPMYLDNPDAGVGGGDTDIAIAPEKNALNQYNIYTSSLTLANVTSSTSLDGGATFEATPISTPTTVNDRQWNTAYGVNTLYLSFNIGATQPGQTLEFYRSSGAGAPGTFLGPFYPRGATADPQISYGLGNMAVDQRPGGDEITLAAGPDGQGNVYHGYHQNDGNEVWVAVSRDFGTTWAQSKVFQGPQDWTADHKFTWVAVDGGGNVYTCWSDDRNVYYSVSQDLKTNDNATWSPPRRVNNGPLTKTCVLPMIEAGSAGRIVLAWYGTNAYNNMTPGAAYHYFHARCNNALDALPLFEQVQVSDHVVHTGIVCQNGLGCSCCRELLECQELGVNPIDGSSIVTYAGAGGIYVTREVAGVSAIEGKSIIDNSGPCPALTDNPPCEEEIVPQSSCILPGVSVGTDPTGDVTALGGPGQDVEQIWVAEPYLGPGVDELVFTMKVASIDPNNLPPLSTWYILFTVTGATNPRKWVAMETCDATQSPTFSYGYLDPTLGFQAEGTAQGTVYADGRIEMRVNSALVGFPQPSSVLSTVEGDVRVFVGAQCTGLVSRVDGAVVGNYTVRGNAYCTPHAVECATDFGGHPGDHPIEFVIDNPSSATRSFDVSLTDANGWIVGGELAQSAGPVSPNSSLTIPVIVRLPQDCTPADDIIQFEATAQDLPPVDATKQCATAVNCDPNVMAVGEPEHRLALSIAGSNPFRASTRVTYAIPERAQVKVEVFNVSGQRVRTLVNDRQEAGSYSVPFSIRESAGTRRLGPGVYLIRITAGEWSRSMRVVGLE